MCALGGFYKLHTYNSLQILMITFRMIHTMKWKMLIGNSFKATSIGIRNIQSSQNLALPDTKKAKGMYGYFSNCMVVALYNAYEGRTLRSMYHTEITT